MKISYNWLQNYFEEKLPTPEIISDGIIFHSFEVDDMDKIVLPAQAGDDTIFDIKVLPDRAHDCLSHWGIAKEISAIFDLKIKNKDYTIFEKKETSLDIKIEDNKCSRYMGRIIRNIKVTESPEWLKNKLIAIGQRPINNIVDAANFVMFDLGQPIHCFDLDKLENPQIIIRNGKNGEKITTLDKKEIDLDESILVIADEREPLAIAGIKGGTKAEVDINTKNIVIEVANFNHTTTRKTAKKINIQTDAVKRYENEISPELCSITMDAISDMICSLVGDSIYTDIKVENIIDVYPKKQEDKLIEISLEYINRRLGSRFLTEDIKNVWDKLKFEYSEKNNIFNIKIPSLRLDLNGPHDLTEEVIRILGYDKLDEKLPEIKKEDRINKIYSSMVNARIKLLNDGYSEVMTYVFCDSGEVEILASASNKKFLRNNLSDGLRESIKLNSLNIPLLEMKEIKVFEIGTVFFKDREEMHVAYGDKNGITEVKLEEFSTEIGSSIFTSRTKGSEIKVFKPWSLYPFITRDIAVWVPEETEPDLLYNIYKELGTDLLIKNPELVDKFKKQDKISYAYRLVFQSYDRTLKDEEVNNIIEIITKKLESLGFQVR